MTLLDFRNLAAVILAIMVPCHFALAAGDGSDTAEESGTFAQSLVREEPAYPGAALRRSQEGWVLVSYVVRADGTVADPIVDDSSGFSMFETSAVEAVKKWEFTPATWNGVPVDQSHTATLLRFDLETERRGVGKKFIRFYEKMQKRIETGDLDGAESTIDERMQRGWWNNSEYSMIWLLKSFIAQQRGDEPAQLAALYRTIRSEGDVIASSLQKNLLPVILGLELMLSKYSATIETYNEMQNFPELLDGREDLVAAVDNVINVTRSQSPLSTPAQITENSSGLGVWSYDPLRRRFSFDAVTGKLHRIELRCDWQRFADEINTGLKWTIPEAWGDCRLYVYGDTGSTFKFIEYQSAVAGQSNTAP